MVSEVVVEMRGLVEALQLVDKRFASAIRKEVRAAIGTAGQDIVQRIRDASSWSTGATATATRPHTSIGDATTLRPNFTVRSAGIRIVTNRRKAPHARPFEGVPGDATFRNGTGGTVKTRPFFFPSVERATPAVEARLLLAMDLAVAQAGFRR